MTPLSTIIAAIRAHPGGTEAVAAEAGVPVHTLIKIVSGETTEPRLPTWIKISDWHASLPKRRAVRVPAK